MYNNYIGLPYQTLVDSTQQKIINNWRKRKKEIACFSKSREIWNR